MKTFVDEILLPSLLIEESSLPIDHLDPFGEILLLFDQSQKGSTL